MGQLPLSLALDRHASFACFIPGRSSAAMLHVKAVAGGRRGEPVWIWGAPGTGKTHLLSAACRAAVDAGLRPMYLDLGTLAETGLLGALETVDFLALDNVEQAAGGAAEAALFTVLDSRLTGTGGLLMAADRAPRECAFALPDLASRAGAAAVYRLRPLDDGDLIQAVEAHAASRGLRLDESAVAYLLRRVGRDLGDLVAWLDRIDRFALAAQRRVTLPLIREVIAAGAPD